MVAAAGWKGQGRRGRSRRAPPAPVPQRGPQWRAGGRPRADIRGVGSAPTDSERECPPSRVEGNDEALSLRQCRPMLCTLATPVSTDASARERQNRQTAGQGSAGWKDSSSKEAVGSDGIVV